jgi:hypothetical protein
MNAAKPFLSLVRVVLLLAISSAAMAQSGGLRSVQVSANPQKYNGACPVTVTFTANFAATAPMIVAYRWVRSDGASSAAQKIAATPAGVQANNTWQVGASFEGWEVIDLLPDTPGGRNVAINKAVFSVHCTSAAPAWVSRARLRRRSPRPRRSRRQSRHRPAWALPFR